MKKLSVTILAIILMIGLTQCRKNTTVVDTIANNDRVLITLEIENNDKAFVNTTNGMVDYEEKDVIYVVSNGKYVGQLTHNGTGFEGTISGAEADYPLCFYFFGNFEPEKTLEDGMTSCSVVISDQTRKLPVISFGASKQLFSKENSAYTVKLFNKCALVKFNVTNASPEEPICMTGFDNKVDIDFKRMDAGFTYNKVDNGIIKLSAGSGDKWAILFPNDDEMKPGEVGTAYSADYRYVGKRPGIKPIALNDFVPDGYNLSVNHATEADGVFTMTDNKRVVFAKGNLQYIAEDVKTPYWKFADNQYDMLGNVNSQAYEGEKINRDHFGWGTGENPNNLSTNNKDYKTYCEWGKNFYEIDGFEWFAPKCVDWKYVMFERPATKLNGKYNARYARATLQKDKGNKVQGIILFPDVYNHPTDVTLPARESINYTTDNQNLGYNENIYSFDDWDKMEKAGAVFLPVTGERVIVDYDQYGNAKLGFESMDEGRYWSQCDLGQEEFACNMYFTHYRAYVLDKNDKYKGFAVRLVREVKK